MCCASQSVAGPPPPPPLPTPCIAGNCGSAASSFVGYGKVGEVVSGRTMTVTQGTPNAIVNWANFNIANGYKVNFLQPSATAQILNNIWSANPSVIAGNMSANGQVYLYNQNGIIFAKGAQINVGSLTASTLNFSPVAGQSNPDYLFLNGLTSNIFNTSSAGTLAPVFQNGPNGNSYAGPVAVEPGAVLGTTSGGRIMLIGSAVTNGGAINTPNGQTLMAAGTKVYLAASTDPALRGFLIEVDASGLPSALTDPVTNRPVMDPVTGAPVTVGTVTNTASGSVLAQTGNITLAGLVVNQAGRTTATTSVSENGSIYLVAGDTSAVSSSGGNAAFYDPAATGFGALLPNNGGTLTLAPGSVTEVVSNNSAEHPDTSTISEQNLTNPAGSAFIASQVNLVGKTVSLLGDAAIKAPGAVVNVNAAGDPSYQFRNSGQTTADGGRIYLDSGSSIDVSGETNVPVAVTRNIVNVTLEGNDLQDDPLLRNGFLHGQQVTINANQTSTLFNVAPYVGNIGIGIDEVLTAGGQIHLTTNGDVIARPHSLLDVSGGSIAFQGGYALATTTLIGANGQAYDIATAPNNIEYVGLGNQYSYTDPRWGIKTSAIPLRYYTGYMQGNNAGAIAVQGPEVYLGGSMLAASVAGPFQRTPTTALPQNPFSSATLVPSGGQFLLGCDCTSGNSKDFHAPAVVLSDNASSPLPADFDYLTDPFPSSGSDAQPAVVLSPTLLSRGGFDHITLYSNGTVDLPVHSTLDLGVDGTLAVNNLASIGIDGTIRGPGSVVALTTAQASLSDLLAHDVRLGADAVIDVSGAWINDSPLLMSGAPGTAPIAITGGSVSLSAIGNLELGAASRIDVSGGGWVNSSNQISNGAAGSINLSALYRPDVTQPYEGTLSLGAGVELLGNSAAAGKGGTLNLSSGSVAVGSTPSATPGELLLAPQFFAGRGFSRYSVVGQNDVVIGGSDQSRPVLLAAVQENLVFAGDALLRPTGSNLANFTTLEALPTSQRAGVNLAFSTLASSTGTGIADHGDVTLGQNAAIVTDAGSTVTLAAGGDSANIDVLGRIIAPAGSINVTLGSKGLITNPYGSGLGYIAGQQILIGPNAVLDASGYSEVNTLNPQGYREGAVLAGGTVSLQANKGFVVTAPTSRIDVRGVSGIVDVIGPNGGVAPALVAGNAGTIDIEAREGLALQGALAGQAAHVSGAGAGTLIIGVDLFDYTGTLYANDASQHNAALVNPYPLAARTLTLTDPAHAATGAPVLSSGAAQISTSTLTAGGFDNLIVKSTDVIALQGSVNVNTRGSVTLDAPLLQGDPGSVSRFSSAYVALGNYDNKADYFTNGNPTAAIVHSPGCSSVLVCAGSLTVDAQLIDVRGRSAFAGFTSEYLRSSGDLRLTSASSYYGDLTNPEFSAELNASGNLTLAAAAVYPTTNTQFTLTSSAAVTIAPATGTSAMPLSAGGALTIEAPTILQEGVLRAPLGQINLQALDTTNPVTGQVTAGSVTLSPGSLTSVSAGGTIIPYGSTVNGQQWTYAPNPSVTGVIVAPPAKNLTLNGTNVAAGGKNASVGSAVVDLSGGGDLYAYEWIAGPGGSKDVLNPASGVYQYAVVPSLGSKFAPLDAQYLWQQGSSASIPTTTPNATQQSIYLSGVPGLAAGYYALLPARYALLPGAFAVAVLQRNSDIAAGSVVEQPSGAYVVAGQLAVAGTNVIDSRSSTVLVSPSSVVRQQSQYTDSYANVFYTAAAATLNTAVPSLPADAGELELLASSSLSLGGSINFGTASFVSGTDAKGNAITQQGAGGVASIQAPNILVYDSATPAATLAASGALKLDAQALDALGAQTLILGGSRQSVAAGEQITVGVTQNIELANTRYALTAPDVILAAQNEVAIDDHAQILAKGTLNVAPSALVLQGAGALLDASTAASLPTVSDAALGSGALPTGTLTLGSGAAVGATGTSGTGKGGNLVFFATGNTTASSDVQLSALGLGLYSSHVSVGEVPTGSAAPSGLILDSQLLGTLKGLTALTLGSSSSIDFYGAMNLGTGAAAGGSLQSITLDTPQLNGYDTRPAGSSTIVSDSVALQAGAITLENSYAASGTAAYQSASAGTGTLTLRATAGSAGGGQITLGGGAKAISGFGGGVVLAAGGLLESQGKGGSLLVNSGVGVVPVNLTLSGSALTAAAGSDQTISATGAVDIGRAGASQASLLAPLGGKLLIEGGSIAQNGIIDLPAGILELHATDGNVTLGASSITAAAGSDASFLVTHAAAAGGEITLSADRGNVVLARGATVDVSGATSSDGKVSSDAGGLTVAAPAGQFQFAGATLKGAAAASRQQGNFTLDAGSGLDFSSLNAALQGGGFTGAIALRTRSDAAVSIAASDSVVARSFELSADQGSIDVAGTINTSGRGLLESAGGPISIWAQYDLTLESSAKLIADASSPGPLGIGGSALLTRGGDVVLGVADASHSIILNGGGISQRGAGDAGTDGTLTLRAPRTADQTGVQIQLPAGGATVSVDTRKPIVVEGFQRYSASVLGSDPGSLDITQDGNPGTPFADAQPFAGNAVALAASLKGAFSNGGGAANPVQVQVRAGVEVDSAPGGDLTVGDASFNYWDLDAWNAALGAPVNLTLRAAGNLIFNASLSDGFGSGSFGGSGAAVDQVAYGVTGSYRLAAGADLAAANPLSVVAQSIAGPSTPSALSPTAPLVAPGTGNLIVTPNNLIRTGDGSIDIAAGGDVLLGFNAYANPAAPAYSYDAYHNLLIPAPSGALTSVIYTAGVPSVLSDAQSALFTPSLRPTPASYPTDGGNVTVHAGNDIQSVPSQQVVSDWLWRRGALNSDGTLKGPTFNTSWWISFDNFDQGIGALGGGDLSLAAARNIVNTAAVIPTTGRLLGAQGDVPSNANLVLTGGGTLSVQAGNDIASGVFEDDWGNALVRAGGTFTYGATLGQQIANPASGVPALIQAQLVYPVLLAGAGSFEADSRGDSTINFVSNSTILPASIVNAAVQRGQGVYFYTYTPDSSVTIASTGGDVTLLDSYSNLTLGTLNTTTDSVYLSLNGQPAYTPTLNVAALTGNINVQQRVDLFPSANGNLNLLAGGSIANVTAGQANLLTLTMHESLASFWANPSNPQLGVLIPPDSGTYLPLQPLHQNDLAPARLVALTGSIAASSLTIPKAVDVVAGTNILDLNLAGKNLNPWDVTLIEAGGSILYSTPTEPVTNQLIPNYSGISLAGPGYLEVLAGHTIDLGDSKGLVTSGNFNDTRLADTGSTIVAGASFGSDSSGALQQPAYQAFTGKYLAPSASGQPSPYASTLIAYMTQLEPSVPSNQTYAGALKNFESLGSSQQLPLLAQVLSDELSVTGIDHNKSGATYDRGYTAINTLFPVSDAQHHALAHQGNLNMFFSQIKTLQGGDIDLMVPGGSVVVGVPNPPSSLVSVSGGVSNLGVLVIGPGVINGFADQNFDVNQSRMLTLEGGDIILWASNGNIDAGKGAKSASAAPPPVIVFNPATNTITLNASNAVTGSGIGQLLSGPGETAGLVNLIAPKGDVNAGDAGIRVAGNLNIAAVQVLGAGNITVAGTSTGVPVSDAGALAGALSGANSLGDASKSALEQMNQNLGASENYQQLTDSLQPTFINVKMFCLGIECETQ